MFIKLLIIVMAINVGLIGCAYRFGTKDRSFPGGYTQISVPVFKNISDEPGIEVLFTNAMIEEVEQSSVAQVVGKSDAPVELRGRILSVKYLPGGVVKGGNAGFENLPRNSVLATEYRILVNVDIELWRVSDQKMLWSGKFEGEKSYSAPQLTLSTANSVNPLYNQSARNINIGLMAKEMMSEAHDRMTENF